LNKGPLASNHIEAGAAWNEFRQALGSNHPGGLHSHINDYHALQTDAQEIAPKNLTLHNPPALSATAINQQITMPEILRAINRLKKSKSPGPDSIKNSMIKSGGKIMLELLHVLFTALWQESTTPQA